MINLLFQTGSELFGYQIDRKNRKLYVSSSKTNYKFMQVPYTHLFDKGMEDKQDNVTKDLPDDEFKSTIILAMAQLGYKNVR